MVGFVCSIPTGNVLAAVLLGLLLHVRLALCTLCYQGIYCYNNDFFYLPEDGKQVAASTERGNIFNVETDFVRNGAMIKTIETKRDGKTIRSIRFTDWKNKVYQFGGDYASTRGESKYIQFEVGEVVTLLQQQGNEGKLCKLYIETNLGQQKQLGSDHCGGDNKPSTSLASGILGAFFGRQDSDTVYVLGLLFVRDIIDINTETTSIGDYPPSSEPYMYNAKTLSVESEAIPKSGRTSYIVQQGANYSYSIDTYEYMYLGVDIHAYYKWSKVTQKAGVDVDVAFEYTTSTKTSSASSFYKYTGAETSSYYCCPANHKCTWIIGQGYGEILLTDPATATVLTKLELDSGATISYSETSAYSGSAYDEEEIFMTLTIDPNDLNDVASPWDACTGNSRKLLQNVTGPPLQRQDFSLIWGFPLQKDANLITDEIEKLLRERLLSVLKLQEKIPGTADLDSLLEPIFAAARLPAGTIAKTKVSGNGFLGKIPTTPQ